MKLRSLMWVLCLGAAASPALAAVDLAIFTFETGQTPLVDSANAGPYAAEGGVAGGNASAHHASALTDYPLIVGNGSARSLSSNEWAIGDYYQFTTNTTGYSSIAIMWDQTRSGTGPATFDLQWSTNGIAFTTLTDNYNVELNGAVGGGSWSSLPANHRLGYTFGPTTGPAALDNQAIVYFRLTSQVTTATGGTNRVDDIIITGIVPEPASLSLLAIGALALIRRNRKA